jgi:hypothetical protein
MLQHIFSLKSIVFYGSAIVSVMTLFTVTTGYGETRLKAATSIAGRYQFVESDCLTGATLQLDQSGLYLTATIGRPDRPPMPPSLSGTWSGTPTPPGLIPLTLTGTMPNLPNCYPAQNVWLQGTLEKQTFSGQLIFATGDRVPFRSQLEPKPTNKPDRSH